MPCPCRNWTLEAQDDAAGRTDAERQAREALTRLENEEPPCAVKEEV